MEQLTSNIIDIFNTHFDISYMLCVNVLAYLIIKTIDDLNGDKDVSSWTKRGITVLASFIIGILYNVSGYDNTIILINSAIIAPVAWSWIFKPIFKRIGIDYKPKSNIK